MSENLYADAAQAFQDEIVRLPGSVVGGDLYSASKRLENIFIDQDDGKNFNPSEIDDVIALLNKVKSSAKSFQSEADIDGDYK